MAAITNNTWYVNYGNGSSTEYYAVTAWPSNTDKAVGDLIRQNAAPTVGNERVFVCIVAGKTTNGTEPTWTVTKGAKNTDNTATWQECTGQAGVNGDATNCPLWTASSTFALGMVIQNTQGTGCFIASAISGSGTSAGSQPAGLTTPVLGATTTDNAGANQIVWTCIKATGPVLGAWAAPFARLQSAVAANWGKASDVIFVGDDHAETQSTTVTVAFPGAEGTPNFVYCVDHTTAVPPGSGNLLATATATVSGATAAFILSGSAYVYGLTFVCAGTGAGGNIKIGNSSQNSWMKFEACSLQLSGTSGTNFIQFTPNAASVRNVVELVNTTFSFGAVGQTINPARQAGFCWRNTASAVIGAAVPTNLISPIDYPGEIVLEGVDLSALGSGKTLIAAASCYAHVAMIDCKLGASVTVAATPGGPGGGSVDLTRCDSGTVTSRHERHHYCGTQKIETTIIRSGGASDGTTGISWNVTTTANSKWVSPFECFPISIWNDTTGSSVTATIEIVNDGVTLKNDDIWIDVEYLGDSGSPLASVATSTKANNLAAGTNITTSTASWTTTGLTTPIKQKIAVSFTPQLKGYYRAYVKMAKATKTVYVDPLVTQS